MDTFSTTLKRLRTEKNMTQQQLADMLNVNRSTITYWESGKRMPDISTLRWIASCLDVDISILMGAGAATGEAPVVIMVDDEKLILTCTLPVIEEAIPGAVVTGFTKPSEAVDFAKENPVSLAFLDIEMGKTSGLELCEALLSINPRTNVVFLTAYMDYSFRAWGTGASGFLMKPLSVGDVRQQLGMLRHPIRGIMQQ